jgi:hypothetical protein
MLAWDLSNIDASVHDGFDNKGPMVTQTLTSIAEAVPFHWRGEQLRGLIDFNPAFENLLGGTKVDTGSLVDGVIVANSDFDNFQTFVLSLTEDRTSSRNRNRVIQSDLLIPQDSASNDPLDPLATARSDNPVGVDAIKGQWDDRNSNGILDAGDTGFRVTCESCHQFPNATTNEVVDNAFGGEANPDRLWLKVAPFQGMQFKTKQHLINVHFKAGTGSPDVQTYPILGTGLSHAGLPRDIVVFMDILLRNDKFGNQDEFTQQRNIASFIYQWDTGQAPATNVIQFVDASNVDSVIPATNPPATGSDLEFLIKQAARNNRNCDIAVIGRLASGSASNPFFGWVYDRKSPADPATGLPAKFFGPDSTGQNDGSRDLSFFRARILAGGWFAFIGMPVGSAWRYAEDFDGDQLVNQLEAPNSCDPFVVDTDGDGVWDGAAVSGGGEPAINNHTANNSPDFINPTSGVIDTSFIPSFQWVTQRCARLTFETDELTTAELTLTPQGELASLPAISVKESTPKLQHNLLVNTLVWPATYNGSLKITDRGGITSGHLSIPKVSKTVTLTPLVLTDGSVVRQPSTAVDSFVMIDALSSTPPTPAGSNRWDFEYSATVVMEDHQGDGNTTKEPKQDVWVAARPILRGAPVTLPQFVVATEQKMGNPLTSFTTFDVNSSEYTPNSFLHNAVTTNDATFPVNHVRERSRVPMRSASTSTGAGLSSGPTPTEPVGSSSHWI